MEDILKIILSKKFVGENWVKKNYPDFHLFIFNLFSEDIPWMAKFFLYKNDIKQVPRCYCGNLTKYNSGEFKTYCSKKCASNDKQTKDKIKQTNIIKYGTDMPLKNKDIKQKAINKWLNNYGVDNPSKSKIIKDKVKNKNLEKFGVEYLSQLKDVKNSLSFHMKNNRKAIEITKNKIIIQNIIKKTKDLNISFLEIKDRSLYEFNCLNCNNNFTIHKNNLNDRINYKNTICTICNPINILDSDGERQLYEFIQDNYNDTIIKNDRTAIKKELDIYLPNLKVAFEYNGIHWHSELYKEKNYHINKTNICENNNIKLIHIWEDDWLYKKDIVKSRILNILNKSEKIWARKCEIREIEDNKTVIDFINKNHIQGWVMSKIKIGLYYNDELVSLMTFGNLRKNMGQNSTKDSWELLRFCNKLNTTIIGGASKLLNYFIKKYNPSHITSYADRDWSSGDLYEKLGFKKISITKPNYYYIIGNVRKNRFSYRKDILVKKGYDPSRTEKEIMLELKYYRIYNSGNIKYEIKK